MGNNTANIDAESEKVEDAHKPNNMERELGSTGEKPVLECSCQTL